LTRSAHRHASTYPNGPFGSQFVGPYYFHKVHIHIGRGIDFMDNTITVRNLYFYIAQNVI
jgi:hypothetical protein